MRCVLDTNALIGTALSPSGTPRRVVEHVLRNGVLLGSRETVEEFETRFVPRTKFDLYLSRERRKAVVARIVALTEIIPVPARLSASPDPDDDRFVELATDGAATCIGTGNTRDVPSGYADIVVVSPAECVQA